MGGGDPRAHGGHPPLALVNAVGVLHGNVCEGRLGTGELVQVE